MRNIKSYNLEFRIKCTILSVPRITSLKKTRKMHCILYLGLSSLVRIFKNDESKFVKDTKEEQFGLQFVKMGSSNHFTNP